MTALTAYIAIFAVGFVFLLFSFVFGGHGTSDAGMVLDASHELDHSFSTSPGVLSFRVIACFLVGFGTGAAIAHSWIGDETMGKTRYLIDLAMGLGVGLLMGFIGWTIIKALLSQQAYYQMDTVSLVGIQAALSLGIPKGGVGEIVVEHSGRRHSLNVREISGRAIPTGTQVKVLQMSGATAIVEAAPRLNKEVQDVDEHSDAG